MGNRYIKTRCEASFDVLFDVKNLMYLLLNLFYDAFFAVLIVQQKNDARGCGFV